MFKFWRKQKEIFLYCFFGFCTFLVDSVVFYLVSHLFGGNKTSLILHLCSIASTTIAIVFAYITNRWFVFQSSSCMPGEILQELLRFFAARVATLIVAEVLMEVTVMHLGFTDWIMKIALNLLMIVLNYIFSKLWIFQSSNKKEHV